ncbi:hypothetical protein ES703_51678 [subsurface metagenome]
MTKRIQMNEQTEDQFIEQEMTILGQRMKLEKRITHGIFMLLLCNLEDLSATFVLELQRDLEKWDSPRARGG